MSRKTRKLIWSAPLVAVLAVAGALAIFAAQGPNQAAAQDAMVYGPPTGVTAMSDGQTVIEVSWMAPATGEATAYRVDSSEDGMIWKAEVTSSADDQANISTLGGGSSTFAHSGLDPGTTMYYRVFAIYGTKGEGEPSATVMAKTDDAMEPGKPTALTAAVGTPPQAAIGLSWTAPTSTGGSDITGYKIERSKSADSGWMTVKADTESTAMTYTDMGLTAGTTYHYRVSAINKAGTGMASDSNNTTTGDGSAPAQVTGLTLQGTTASATLHWLSPGDPDGSPITGYKIERHTDSSGTGSWMTVDTTATAATSYQVGNALQTATEPWDWRVTAINAVGEGAASVALANTLPPDPAANPMVPGLRAGSKAPLSIRVSWRTMATTVDGHRVDYSEDGKVWIGISTPSTAATGNRTYYDDTGLEDGEMRYYRVFAMSGTTVHQVSGVVSATAGPPGTPAKPTALEAAATAPTADTITLTWTLPADDSTTADFDESTISGLRIERSPQAASGWTTHEDLDDETLTAYADTKLTAKMTWHYRVRGINGSVVGPASDSVSAKTMDPSPAGSPTGLVAVARGMSRVDLYWNAPDDPLGAPVTGYKVEVTTDGGATWTTVIADTGSTYTMYSHTGLSGDATRTYRVSAINSAGAGATSPADTAMTGMFANTAPMPGDAIADQTVMVNMTVMVQSTITDMDMGDTLMWEVMSSNDDIATAMVDDMGMVTVTGAMASSDPVTITVTATDASGVMATQTFMVTVTAAMLTAPVILGAEVTARDGDPGIQDINVSWTNGANATTHAAYLYDPSRPRGERIVGRATNQTDGMTTFQNVDSGTYAVVVVAFDDEFNMELTLVEVMVP